MEELEQNIRNFAEEREWGPYHSPKNLSMALSVEVSEIVEIFQWLTQEQSKNLNSEQRLHLEEEIGDVMIYLTYLASQYDINPIEAAQKKMQINKTRFPVKK